ncbi:arsenic transporter [Terriglobus aquaticus]|uniref:Arsenic transporter n=1 Tax=Terriglobus aquaticus TaxID=940139 RepID=A0ABW9KIX6_9BACT|nr:arsenic transporter [Terriglobus aquaticus]
MITTVLILSISALSIALMLLRPKNLPEVYWVGAGAILLVALRLVPLKLAGKAVAEGSDVYFFLIGMMLLSALARENGVFDWVASTSISAAKGSCSRLFLLIYGVGTIVTICMSNDATAVVLTPAVLAAVKKSKAKPLPFLFACAMIANAASFVLPISNPANLVVFHAGLPSLGRWLASFLLPSVLSIAVTFLVLRWYFRKDIGGELEQPKEKASLRASGRLVLWGLGLVVVVLLVFSSLKKDLGLPTCIAALCVTAVVCIRNRCNPLPLAKEVSWSTLGLVAALFVLVDAVESVGALRVTESALRHAEALGTHLGSLVTALVVAVANNLLNNLPLGLIAGATITATHTKGLLSNAVLIGVDLGPNLSVTGSLATILWLMALRKEDIDVSAWDFLKVGAIAMPAALLASMAGAFLMHAVVPAQ